MLEIDGSIGEGGGQVLRTSMTLSCITGKPIHITKIRAKRSKPGLRPQHLKSVEASAAITDAKVEGAVLGSTDIFFSPGKLKNGQYHFEIGTAGSTSLLLQTIFIPLAFTHGTSRVQIGGGTHVPWSPCFDYIDLHWLLYMDQIGYQAELNLERAGYYPPGGGKISARIKPLQEQKPLHLYKRGNLVRIRGISAVANLDPGIATRQKHQALRRLQPIHKDTKIQTKSFPATSKGTYILLIAEFEHSQCCYFSLGKKGKPAEAVADDAVDELLTFINKEGAVDRYLADQLVLPLSLVQAESIIITENITKHLLTNAAIIQKFLPVKIQILGSEGHSGQIKITN